MSTSAFERDENELNPITADIGYNDGANGGFWRVQPRQKTGRDKGQWIEMGAEIRAYFKDLLGKVAGVSGRALGSDGTPDGVRVLIQGQSKLGIPDGIYRFNTKNVRVAEALLPEEYIETQGVEATIPGDIDAASVPSIDSLERADITPDDIRLANEGINSAEGKEMSAFKNSPEGQEIARLDEETAANVQQGIAEVAPDSAQAKADDLMARAMRDEDIDLDQELDDFLENPDEVPVEDINVSPTGRAQVTDPEFDMEPVAKSAISADEVAIDDFIDDDNDGFFKVTSTDVDEDGNWEIYGLDKDGDEVSLFGGRSDRVRRIDEFDEPGNAPVTVPIAPANVAPAAKPKAEMPEDAARLDSVWNTKPGDVIYDRNGNKLGTVESVSKSGSYANPNKSAEVVLLGDDGSKSKKMIMDSQALSRVAAPEPEAPEVPEAPEAPALNADEPKANAAGFTKALRYSLRGMKGDRNKDRQAYARALANGRTSTILQDDDGTWFLEKHDEFNGGIKEVKQFDSLDDALAEGTDFLQNNDPKFDAPGQPAELPQSKNQPIIETPAKPQAQAQAQNPPKEPETDVARQGLIEDLTPGTLFWDNSGKKHTVTAINNNNGKVTVDYTDENGEAKSKRFREGTPVDLQPNDADKMPVSKESNGKPATQEQKDQIGEFDDMDSENPITDEDLRDRLMDAYNAIQDGDDLDEGELQDLIDELQDHFTGTSGGSKGGTPAGRRIDDGQNILAPEMSPEEMRAAKVKGKGGGKSDPDAALDMLAQHYPNGGFINNPADALNGGFVARRDDIDGGEATLETIVLRTIGNKFLVAHRVTNKRTGEVTTVVHYKARESYAAIHSPAYGLDVMHEHLAGNTSPIDPKSSSRYRKNFEPGKSWTERLKYWRTDKARLDESKMDDIQRERLNRDFNGDVDAMAEALRIQNTKLRTFEEHFAHLANGQDEKLNETTDYILNNKMRSSVASFFAALESGNVDFAKARYQEMMNMIPELSPELKKSFIKVVRKGLTARMNATGTTGKERTRALQVFSAAVTNYIKHADKQWSLDNDLKLPHVSGTGVKVAKRGDIAVWEDNEGNTFTGRIVSLRRESGPNGYNDFVRMQFMDKDGRVKTLNTDLNAKNIKLKDAGTPLDAIDFKDARWKRLGDLAWNRGFKKGGADQAQEDTDIKKAGRLARGLKWVDPSDPSYNPNLGSDGVEGGEDEEGSFVVPKSGSKPASELTPGDTVYGTDGTPLGTITAIKMTSKNGEPIMAVKFRDADGNTKTIAYGVDQMVGPNERGGDDNPKG